MTMNSQKYSAKLQRLTELLAITFLGDIPTIFLGPQLRRLLYRHLFAAMLTIIILQNVHYLSKSRVSVVKGL